MGKRIALLTLAAAAQAGPANAQSNDRAEAFTGAYAGLETGAHEHHFFIDTTDLQTGTTQGRYYRAWGVGGGAFVGYDHAVGDRVRVGLEAGLSVGGDNPQALFPDGTTYTQHPRYGYRVTGKAGFLITDRLLAYGTLGYGGHQYRAGGTAQVQGVDESQTSYTIGAGVEYRLSSRAGVRLDFRHLDNSMSHILVGVPVRFR
jgi:outer membrane immunogenic protein